MSRAPFRLLCTAALCALAAAAGCGSAADPVGVGVLELKASFTNPGSPELVDSGMDQLTSELAVDASLQVCEAAGLSREVAALAEGGEGLILVTGRGDQVLDAEAAGTGMPLVGLGVNLLLPGSAGAAPAGGVTSVRYKVEEGAYLSGVLAAGMTVIRGNPWINPEAVVCFIGCAQDPQRTAYFKGFEAGVASVNPGCAIAEYDVTGPGDLETARAVVEAALKLKADIFFCMPGQFSREVLALGSARSFLAITSDADGTAEAPDSLLASTVLRDDLAMFRVTRDFLRGDLPSGVVEWGIAEGIVDFSVNMKQYLYIPAAVDQSLKRPVPDDLK